MTKRWGGCAITAGVLAAVLVAAVLGGPWLLHRAGLDEAALPWGPDCTVDVDGESVGLDQEQAMAATTAVALRWSGSEATDPEGVPPEVLRALADGPTEDAGPILTCGTGSDTALAPEAMTESGLTPRAETVLAAMGEVFGEQSLGGYAPGGIDSGHGSGSAHYDGRAIDVFYRPVSEENRRAGWLLAHWLVAHAMELELAVVIFDDRIWSSRFAPAGWRDYEVSDPDNLILRHVDHVHVDVRPGTPGTGIS
ncbi:hypothetical protein [Nocardiopsis ansamitocini]|uniref:ARB-07466-like C-terminal domain-containing protein n=1 Tax=Nocardiopsis ansamitocini TaxID=1670832 RepID=A0A9W6UGU1_9ACTN|nr:hypothetical protein [Nocardiopsis ansamitocini]GLU45829.1 hypothetical protein Nans01_01800 [Nocardiopsis ansamitocini]